MRIVGGEFRGKRLVAPEGKDAVRPTSDRTREAVFNVLLHKFQGPGFSLIGARVADVFAGTGAMGLEALSRGAAHATFVEKTPQALKALAANIAAMAPAGATEVVRANATALPMVARPVSIAFLDPPYDAGLLEPALASLAARGWLEPGALCVCETAFTTDVTPPEGFTAEDERRYGKAKVTFLRWAP